MLECLLVAVSEHSLTICIEKKYITHCTSTEHFQVMIRNAVSLLEIDAQDSWLLQGGGYSMYNKIKKTRCSHW
jgi:hypothetical protein